jgi:glycosyltransferase involved in cell wall biosynthesis
MIFDTVDLHFVREAAEVEVLGADADPGLARQAELGRRMELGLVQAFDQTWVVSTDEAALLESLVPGVDVRVIPTIQGSQPTTPTFDERRDLLFVGNFNHPPNQDAMRWSAAEVLPAIRRRLPDVRLHVAGGALPDSVRDQLDDGFVVHGWAPDLSELYGSARLAFVPLRYGAGVKTKVTEAFGRGVPVVTTPVGVEGMPPELQALATVGTTAEELADAVAGLYEDRDRWDALHAASPKAIDAVFGEAAVQQLVERALDAAESRRS